MYKRILVHNNNVEQLARETVEAAKKHFHVKSLLSLDDRRWAQEIQPWIDGYVEEHFLCAFQSDRALLDDCISIAVSEGNYE